MRDAQRIVSRIHWNYANQEVMPSESVYYEMHINVIHAMR